MTPDLDGRVAQWRLARRLRGALGITAAVGPLLAPVLGLILLAGGVGAQEPPPVHDPRVLPGDLVRIRVWREPDWDGDFLVDQFGVVALPFVGDVQTAGLTQWTLKAKLREAYGREVENLVLTVLVLKRIRVSGEVRSPGIHPLDPTLRVADALILSGGRTPDGKANEVVLRRAGQTEAVNVLVDTRLSDLALETGDELVVRQRPWLSRNAMGVLGSGLGLISLFVLLLVR
jgi:polysaccharide export outer membrane protein